MTEGECLEVERGRFEKIEFDVTVSPPLTLHDGIAPPPPFQAHTKRQ